MCAALTSEVVLQTMEVPDVWEHDLFEDDRRPAPVNRSSSFGGRKSSAKLIITNLDYGVNDQDIRVRIDAVICMLRDL